jgi:NAD(P)-dependent dehydrogenase (short-subunit alcohol dehydrogenase family)
MNSPEWRLSRAYLVTDQFERAAIMTSSLTGRRALVTGGSRGIGAEIVRRLAGDGAAVAFTYGASAADAEKLVAEVAAGGGTAVAIQADSGDAEQVARSVDETVARLGGLDTWSTTRAWRTSATSSP